MKQSPASPYSALIERSKQLHKLAHEKAAAAVNAAIECGTALRHLQRQCVHGDWLRVLDQTGIPQRTAARYMILSEKVGSRTHQLTDGITLVDLYREFGLIQATTGGGRRLGESELQRRKFDVRYQMTNHWSDVSNWLEKVDKALAENFNPFAQDNLEVDLDATERQLEATLGLVRDAKSQRAAVDVESAAQTTES